MSTETIHIKNMVCRRCIMTVESICEELNISGMQVELGHVIFQDILDPDTRKLFYDRLTAVGFEPIESRELVVLERIKTAIQHYARHYTCDAKEKLSVYMADALGLDFRYASRLFSNHEGRTIQSYLMAQRMEYVKELLMNDELTLAEIADAAGFSSVAHLSGAFKKSQGITLSEFRNGGMRMGIDEI